MVSGHHWALHTVHAGALVETVAGRYTARNRCDADIHSNMAKCGPSFPLHAPSLARCPDAALQCHCLPAHASAHGAPVRAYEVRSRILATTGCARFCLPVDENVRVLDEEMDGTGEKIELGRAVAPRAPRPFLSWARFRALGSR